MHARAERLGLLDEATNADKRPRLEAVVLRVNQDSARVRLLSEGLQVTFRSSDACDLAPGQVVTLVEEKRWTWRGDAYASGEMLDARIDLAKLGLEPLPLHGGELCDLRKVYEPYRRRDPYSLLWKMNTVKPRACYEMDPIAWGAFSDSETDDFDGSVSCDAADLAAQGDVEGARELLMSLTLKDLRCLDAHAHLGHLEFDLCPEAALVHYEIGVRIGELSLPPGFDGALLWGSIYNRPFLRCLHGHGLSLWRLGRMAEAQSVFERVLSLNPNDNQGARFCWEDVRNGRSWEEMKKDGKGEGANRAELLH